MSVWSARIMYAISIRNRWTDDILFKLSVTNRFDEDIDETVALQDVLERETHNLDHNWDKDRQYFAWNFGEGNALEAKNDLKALCRIAGLQRSDVYNRQGDRTADYFDMNGENDKLVLKIVQDFLTKKKINLGDTFVACPICSKHIYDDKTTYSCDNAQIEDNDRNKIERTCLTIIHERCMKKYLKKHPRCSHDIEGDWVCADCIDG